MTPDPKLGLSCPSGGDFYVCTTKQMTSFLGCCMIDPCAGGTSVCPQPMLRPASFAREAYGSILPQYCDQGGKDSNWYACSDNNPPFLGCCTQNACGESNGCPAGSLIPAALSYNLTKAAPFLIGGDDGGHDIDGGGDDNSSVTSLISTQPSTFTIERSTIATSPSNTDITASPSSDITTESPTKGIESTALGGSSTLASPTASQTDDSGNAMPPKKENYLAIELGLGLIAAVALLLAACYLCWRRKRKNESKEKQSELSGGGNDQVKLASIDSRPTISSPSPPSFAAFPYSSMPPDRSPTRSSPPPTTPALRPPPRPTRPDSPFSDAQPSTQGLRHWSMRNGPREQRE